MGGLFGGPSTKPSKFSIFQALAEKHQLEAQKAGEDERRRVLRAGGRASTFFTALEDTDAPDAKKFLGT